MKFYLLIAALLFSSFALGQHKLPYIDWQTTIGGNGEDGLISIRQTTDGGFIAGGYTRSGKSGAKTDSSRGNADYWIMKLNNKGYIQWQKTIGGNYDDILTCVRPVKDGGYIVAGYSTSDATGEKTEGDLGINCGPVPCYDWWILKLDAAGNIVWQNTIGGNLVDMVFSVEQTFDDGYILAGASTSGISGDKTEDSIGDGADVWILKLNAVGNIEWQNTIGGNHGELALSIQQTSDSGYIVGAYSNSDSGYDKSENPRDYIDYWVLKLNPSGNIVWQRTIGGGGEDEIRAIRQTHDGGYVMVGTTNSGISYDKTVSSYGDIDYWVVKLSAWGDMLWQRDFGGEQTDWPGSIEVTDDGGCIIGGYSNSGISGNKTTDNKGGNDIWLIKLDTAGNEEWQKDIGGTGEDGFGGIQQIMDGNYILGGTSNSNISGDKTANSYGLSDFWIMKIILKDACAISGNVFMNDDGDCLYNGEKGTSSILIKTSPVSFFARTDEKGNYTLYCDTGHYEVREIVPQNISPLFHQEVCPASHTHSVNFTAFGQDTAQIDFASDVLICPYLNVELTQPRLRRCFVNDGTLNYCNIGNADTTNVQVHLELPEHVTLTYASHPYTVAPDGHFIFYIDTLRANACGQIYIQDYVACENGLTGLTECIKTWITPANKCVQQSQPTYSQWDQSDVIVKGRCTPPYIQFVIYNLGQSMTDSSTYRIYKDGVLAITRNFKMDAGDSAVITIAAVTNTIRLEADQRPFHPGNSHPNATVQNCVQTIGFRSASDNLPPDDADIDVAIVCLQIRDSYDPNSKEVSPKGVTDNQSVARGVSLNYTINFQNTGNDTAYNIIVDDTLSANLDLSTLELGASSHPYKLEIAGKNIPVLRFIFDNIYLADSFTNERKSHGYVSFKIKPYDTIPNNTVVKNFADIYFDFNSGVRTNSTQVNITDNLPSGAVLNLVTNTNDHLLKRTIKVFPNPSAHFFVFDFSDTKPEWLRIYNTNGDLIDEVNVSGKTTYQYSRENMSSGMYYYSVEGINGTAHGKLIVIAEE